jgi:8-oxo-dGTP pyrophosphatase MutT (NUDIX family)
MTSNAAAAAAPDPLAALPDAALRGLIRRRLLAAPGGPAVGDLRYGAASLARRPELRAFFPERPTPAAVLLPLIERDAGLTVLFTQRADHLKHHAGQISFPGGRMENADADAVATALRESEEEIGLGREHVAVAGFLPDHVVVSGYRVTPVVAFVRPGFDLRIDRSEVADVFEVPLPFFLDSRNHVPRTRHFEGHEVTLVDMPFGSRNIWGATANMLLTLYRVLGGEPA